MRSWRRLSWTSMSDQDESARTRKLTRVLYITPRKIRPPTISRRITRPNAISPPVSRLPFGNARNVSYRPGRRNARGWLSGRRRFRGAEKGVKSAGLDPMLDPKQLKVQGLRYGRTLQTLVRICSVFNVDHPSALGPTA